MTKMHTAPKLIILSACRRTKKTESLGVSVRSDRDGYHRFPRVERGAGEREVVTHTDHWLFTGMV